MFRPDELETEINDHKFPFAFSVDGDGGASSASAVTLMMSLLPFDISNS